MSKKVEDNNIEFPESRYSGTNKTSIGHQRRKNKPTRK